MRSGSAGTVGVLSQKVRLIEGDQGHRITRALEILLWLLPRERVPGEGGPEA